MQSALTLLHSLVLTTYQIRDEVYRLVLHIDGHCQIPNGWCFETQREGPFLQNAPRPGAGILRFNHQLSIEATPFLYSNHFVMTELSVFPDFLGTIGENAKLLRSIDIGCTSLNLPDVWHEDVPGRLTCEIFELLGSLPGIRRIDTPMLELHHESFEWLGSSTWDLTEDRLNARQVARAIFPTIQKWLNAMLLAGKSWKNILSLAQDDHLRIYECSELGLAYNSEHFCQEIEELMANPDGMRLQVTDVEATVQWSGLNRMEWCRPRMKTWWIYRPWNPNSCQAWDSVSHCLNGNRLCPEQRTDDGRVKEYTEWADERERMGKLLYHTLIMRKAFHLG